MCVTHARHLKPGVCLSRALEGLKEHLLCTPSLKRQNLAVTLEQLESAITPNCEKHVTILPRTSFFSHKDPSALMCPFSRSEDTGDSSAQTWGFCQPDRFWGELLRERGAGLHSIPRSLSTIPAAGRGPLLPVAWNVSCCAVSRHISSLHLQASLSPASESCMLCMFSARIRGVLGTAPPPQ